MVMSCSASMVSISLAYVQLSTLVLKSPLEYQPTCPLAFASEMWHLMRRELMSTSVGRRATGDIPTVRDAQGNGRSSTALQMARHAARDLLRQLDVRLAESRAR